MRTLRAFLTVLLAPALLLGQARTFTPTLRASSALPLSIAQVDGNFSGLASISNGAARTYTAASQAAMLALNPLPQQGDFCQRTDTSTVWLFKGGDPTSLGNWEDPLASAVPATRNIFTTAGQLTGGGSLAADRTLGLATTAVTASSYGTALLSPTFTVDAYGRLTAAGTATPSYVPSGTGAVTTTFSAKLQKIVHVEDYGAIGDGSSHPLSGVTSFNGINTTGYTLGQWQVIFPHATALSNELDWCAIQAAVNGLAGPGVVLMQAKSYQADQPVAIVSGTVLQGVNSQGTTITYTGTGTAIGVATPGTRLYGCSLKGLKVTSSSGALGVDWDSVSSGYCVDVLVNGFTVGVSLHSTWGSGGCVYNEFISCTAQNCPTGWQVGKFGGSDNTGINSNRFLNCRANICSTYGWSIKDGNQNVVFDSQIENCGVGFQVDAGTSGSSNGNQVAFCRFEGNTTNWVVNSANVIDARIVNNLFVTNATVSTDSGTRTVAWGNNGSRWVATSSLAPDASGVFQFVAPVNVGSNLFFNVKDTVSSSGTPILAQFEEDRTGGVSAQGYNGTSVVWKLLANGGGLFTGAVTGVTDSANTNNTDLATTAYVDRASGANTTTPSDPTATTSSSIVMMGLAGSITPTRGGKVLVTISGQMANATINDGVVAQLRTSSVGNQAAPSNGGAAAGTTRGAQQQHTSLVAGDTAGFSITAYVSGLTVGQAYWIDLGLRVVTGGTASATGVTITAVEVP